MRRFFSLVLSVCVTGVLISSLRATALTCDAKGSGGNVIQNPYFAEEDMEVWGAGQGGADITVVTEGISLPGDVSSCGMISGRTSPYECFAQDITGVVQNGKEYQFSFWAMLSQDYAGAPAEQRELHFAPYVTIDGNTSYLGSYSAELTGDCSKVLEPGEWTYYEGRFKVDYTGNIEQIVIRLLEQGSNYGQGECVLGDYYVTAVTLSEAKDIQEERFALEDVTPVKDAVTQVFGEDYLVGGAVTVAEISDPGVAAIVRKHFNALTIGNELKPDALFGYSNHKCPGTTTDILNGEELVVPVMDYSRAETILDMVKSWNEEDPENTIKMRGHVLVWHAQTPEWFFHEDYDASKGYVSKEEMDKRLEWYIKTVLEHFTGEDSPYKGMFYGWDVVNEAISDGTGKYRTDTENSSESLTESTHGSNSSWWHVYQSEEFIINAFRYANKYAPAEVELYYNDYNEFAAKKMNGILGLITTVKEAEGTRLDGMGMQGHYSVDTPDVGKFEVAMKVYGNTAGSVQITEWDMTASSKYDGTEATEMDEYIRIANRYKKFYNTIQKLKNDGINVTGMTFWGTVDKYSWLQSSSNVGGGTDGKRKQCPLLFDDDYKVKPAYWAFVNQDLIETNGVVIEEPVVTEAPKETEAPLVSEEAVNEPAESAPVVNEKAEDVAGVQSGAGKSVFGWLGLGGLVVFAGVVLVLRVRKKKS